MCFWEKKKKSMGGIIKETKILQPLENASSPASADLLSVFVRPLFTKLRPVCGAQYSGTFIPGVSTKVSAASLGYASPVVPPHCHSSLGDELGSNLFCNQLFSTLFLKT